MARVTVEDCVQAVPDRFELVLLAAERVREIGRGQPVGVPENKDKKTVIALREIAEQIVDPAHLRDACVRSFQQIHIDDEPDADIVEAGTDNVIVPDLDNAWQKNNFESTALLNKEIDEAATE